jgi:hypothetical protein
MQIFLATFFEKSLIFLKKNGFHHLDGIHFSEIERYDKKL